MNRNSKGRVRRDWAVWAAAIVLVWATAVRGEEGGDAPRETTPYQEGAITFVEPGTPRKNRDSGTYFVDESGVPTLTNRPGRYRSNPRYDEIRIKYSPVLIPGRYQFYDSARKYSEQDIRYLVRRYARRYGLDENLVLAVIKAESAFEPYAVSKAGARGLMQPMPGTAAEMNVTRVFDPAQNIAGGTQYLAQLLAVFENDAELALAAYNAGPGTVKKYGGVPPFKETRAYIRRVQRYQGQFARVELSVDFNPAAPKPSSDYLPAANHAFVVHFVSGTTQPASAVTDKDPYYVITFAGRHYTVRKSLVKKITKSA